MTDFLTDLAKDSVVKTGTGRAAMMIAEDMFTKRFAYASNGLIEYVGFAKVGTADAGGTWAIKKNAYTGNQIISIKWGSGNTEFDKCWDSRASYAYT